MRHEFRTQSSEGRKLAERLTAAIEQIQQLETSIQQTTSRLRSDSTSVSPDVSAAELTLHRLCETLAEIDFHLTRTVQIAIDSLAERLRAEQEQQRLLQHFAEQIEAQLQRTGRLRRWLLGSWPKRLQASLQPPNPSASAAASSAVAALRMLDDRVARLRSEAGIERLDVAGKPFDGTLMNAVESVPSTEVPKGHVVTQLCPAYRWRDSIVRYAEVNVSQGSS